MKQDYQIFLIFLLQRMLHVSCFMLASWVFKFNLLPLLRLLQLHKREPGFTPFFHLNTSFSIQPIHRYSCFILDISYVTPVITLQVIPLLLFNYRHLSPTLFICVNKTTYPSYHVINTYSNTFCIYVNNLRDTVQLDLEIKFVSVHHLQHRLLAPCSPHVR